MFYAQQPGNLEMAVMQVPYVFSCQAQSGDSFDCPDALVINDFEACLSELQGRGLKGIALLIDEADCLGKNVPLLQMFRNIFQIVEGCSLLLAGTEAVFPALSEVFSPIPRQFYRIDIKPFASWADTSELVFHPFPEGTSTEVAPKLGVVQELHKLCGGAPDEVQLYCHHMYRGVEIGSSPQMCLSPQVFREVLREYRSNSFADVGRVVSAIERLPDKLLFQSKWLSRRKLSLDENILVELLTLELKRETPLTSGERASVVTELTEGYRKLFELGITETEKSIQLAGAPLSSGFWKSFVEVERCNRWTWNDRSFGDNLSLPVMQALGKANAVVGSLRPILYAGNTRRALESLREGGSHINSDYDWMREMITSASFALDKKATNAVDVDFQIDSPAGKESFGCRFLEKPAEELLRNELQAWIDKHQELLARNHISIVITEFWRWQLPTPKELHRLGWISGHRIPKEFGPDLYEDAFSMFKNGDIQGCADVFKKMQVDRESPTILNNIAFCQILLGQLTSAVENLIQAVAAERNPLYELNKGITEYLQGDSASATRSLRNALQHYEPLAGCGNNSEAVYVLILEHGGSKVRWYEELPTRVAILINLYRMDDLDEPQLKEQLKGLYPDKAQAWLETFAAL